jgi:hypothetical protein
MNCILIKYEDINRFAIRLYSFQCTKIRLDLESLMINFLFEINIYQLPNDY